MVMHNFKMRLAPPPGKKKIGDWHGLRVRTLHEMSNGWGTIPAGTVATVESCTGGVGLTLRSEPCKCCGLRVLISRVHNSEVEVVPHNAQHNRPDAVVSRLGPRALLLCRTRGWSTQWDARVAQMLCEVAELADAIRGKRGNPIQEAGDVLLVLASLLEANGIPLESAVDEAHRKIDALMDVPRYPGEHFGSGGN